MVPSHRDEHRGLAYELNGLKALNDRAEFYFIFETALWENSPSP